MPPHAASWRPTTSPGDRFEKLDCFHFLNHLQVLDSHRVDNSTRDKSVFHHIILPSHAHRVKSVQFNSDSYEAVYTRSTSRAFTLLPLPRTSLRDVSIDFDSADHLFGYIELQPHLTPFQKQIRMNFARIGSSLLRLDLKGTMPELAAVLVRACPGLLTLRVLASDRWDTRDSVPALMEAISTLKRLTTLAFLPESGGMW